MLKIKFLKILDEILSREYLKGEERKLINIIREESTQLPEKVSTNIVIEKLGLMMIKGITDEDGYFKEFINTINNDSQESQTEIFYLLKDKQVSCLHKLQTTETWQWLGGEDLSIYIHENGIISEIILNADNATHVIPANTLFGAKLTSNSQENFSLVTCKCIPGFLPEHYQNPTSEDLKKLLSIPGYKQVIEELTPKVSKKNNIIVSILQFFTCCIGVKKNEEQTPLINTSQNNR